MHYACMLFFFDVILGFHGHCLGVDGPQVAASRIGSENTEAGDFWWTLFYENPNVFIPIGSMGLVYLSTFTIQIPKCRQIYHTWDPMG